MGHRNIICASQMIDYLMDEEEWHHRQPDPHTLVENMTLWNTPTFEQYNNATCYGMMPHTDVEHHHATNTTNFYNPYMPPSTSTTVFGVSFSDSSSEQLPSYWNQQVSGIPSDEYVRKNYQMDGNRASIKMTPSANTMLFGISLREGTSERSNSSMDASRTPYKRKNAEAIPGNLWHSDASASSSSSVAASDTRHLQPGFGMVNSGLLAPVQFRINETPSGMTEGGSHRTLRNRSGSPILNSVIPDSDKYLFPESYTGQPFGAVQSTWLDQQLNYNHGDGGAVSWNQGPTAPHLHGSNVSGSYMDIGTNNFRGYYDAAGHFPPPFEHMQHNLYHLPPPHIQGLRSQNVDFCPQVAASSRFPMINTAHGNVNHSLDGLNTGLRQRGPFPPTGLGIYQNHHWGAVPEPTPRLNSVPYLRVSPTDVIEVPMVDFPEYHETGHIIDHHEDMRLDIEDMSYEELLALEEQIGNVNTGLSEEAIWCHLNTRIHISSATYINLEEPACEDQETASCSICQSEFENQEKIGTLDCGHEYHADCLKKWLLVKNICPICKSSALSIEKK